ncbi:MAG: exo-alpha-sialidase [Luteimonas sp.]|nr:exo-alpha-sialidase [Luteimonas sp.]
MPVFVATGKQLRRAISCDDGLTWKNDVSVDDAWPANERYRCFSGNFALPDGGSGSTDCDHNAYSSTALAYGNGVFLQTAGWGTPGSFFRSTDGVTWSQAASGPNVQDVMVGPNRWLLATRDPRKSDDFGLTWTQSPSIPLSMNGNTIYNVRGGAYGGGTYVVSAQDGANTDWQISRDEGETWQRPTLQGGTMADCGAAHPAFGNGIFVGITWCQAQTAAIACRSADNGQTWTRSTIGTDAVESRPLWTGSQFMAWSNGKVHRSTDGITWTSTPTQRRVNGSLSGSVLVGAVAVSAQGTLVAVRGGWQTWYEQQRFYRSTDGILWDELPESAYRKGHPVIQIVWGLARKSAVCP